MMKLEVLPARHGDCLLLHFGSKAQPRLAVIDGGPAGVYAETLLPRLEEIREERGIGAGEPLVIDLLIVSHIDDDHANGIVRFLRDLQRDAAKGVPPRFRVRRLWHNSFDDIIGNSESETKESMTRQFGTASAGEEDIPRESSMDIRDWQVLAGISQGHTIRELAGTLNIPVNPEFGGGLVKATADAERQIDDLHITVLGPLDAELRELEESYDKWLKKRRKRRDSGEALLAAFADKSVANLSSIVLLVSSGSESMLLTGDARGDKILEAIAQRGLASRSGKLKVGLLKVPHHGSDRNVTEEFFAAVPARRYVLSGDGEHSNPERACIEWIAAARGKSRYTLHFTYPLHTIDERRRDLFERPKGRGKTPVWDDASDGIAGFVSTLPATVSIVADEKPRIA